MRLFIAIELDARAKDALQEMQAVLKRNSESGSFTHRDNLHLTVVFIGETDRAAQVKHTLDTLREPPFELTLSGVGAFSRSEGEIAWCGVREHAALRRIFTSLVCELRKQGFAAEDRKYTPHITLGRKIKRSPNFDWVAYGKTLPPLQVLVSGVSLMKSERIGGKLLYTTIYKVPLV